MQEPVFTSMWANARDNSYHDCCSGQHRSPCLQFIPHTANSWPFSSSSLIICHLFILSFLNRNKILDLGIIAFVCLLHLSLIMLTVSPLLLPLSRYLPSNSSPITVYSFPTLFFPSPPLLIVISWSAFNFHLQQHIFSSVSLSPSCFSNLRGLLVPQSQYFYHVLPDVKGTCEQVISSISLQAL